MKYLLLTILVFVPTGIIAAQSLNFEAIKIDYTKVKSDSSSTQVQSTVVDTSSESTSTRASFVKFGDIKGESSDSESSKGNVETELKVGKGEKGPSSGNTTLSTNENIPSVAVQAVEVRVWDPEKKKEFLERVMEHAEIQSEQDLENFATGVLLQDERIEHISFNFQKIKFEYNSRARFLGLFEVPLRQRIEVTFGDLPAEASAQAGGEQSARVEVRFPWYHILMKKGVQSEELEAALEAELRTIGDDSQINQTDLEFLRERAQTLQIISNVSKMIHDTAMVIIRKIG